MLFRSPEDKIIIGMFNNINKVGPIVWDAWLKILEKAPKAILWVLDPGDVAKENILKFSSTYKLEKERIIFSPKLNQDDHLARLQLCDLIVDPWPYGGHTTTGDALFCGIPVVCLEGENFASRVSGGLIQAAGLAELIFSSMEQYILGVKNLVNNSQALDNLKQKLKMNRTKLPVFNAQLRTKQLEAAFIYCLELKTKKNLSQNIRVKVKE